MRIIAYMWLSVAGHKFIVNKHQPTEMGHGDDSRVYISDVC